MEKRTECTPEASRSRRPSTRVPQAILRHSTQNSVTSTQSISSESTSKESINSPSATKKKTVSITELERTSSATFESEILLYEDRNTREVAVIPLQRKSVREDFLQQHRQSGDQRSADANARPTGLADVSEELTDQAQLLAAISSMQLRVLRHDINRVIRSLHINKDEEVSQADAFRSRAAELSNTCSSAIGTLEKLILRQDRLLYDDDDLRLAPLSLTKISNDSVTNDAAVPLPATITQDAKDTGSDCETLRYLPIPSSVNNPTPPQPLPRPTTIPSNHHTIQQGGVPPQWPPGAPPPLANSARPLAGVIEYLRAHVSDSPIRDVVEMSGGGRSASRGRSFSPAPSPASVFRNSSYVGPSRLSPEAPKPYGGSWSMTSTVHHTVPAVQPHFAPRYTTFLLDNSNFTTLPPLLEPVQCPLPFRALSPMRVDVEESVHIPHAMLRRP